MDTIINPPCGHQYEYAPNAWELKRPAEMEKAMRRARLVACPDCTDAEFAARKAKIKSYRDKREERATMTIRSLEPQS